MDRESKHPITIRIQFLCNNHPPVRAMKSLRMSLVPSKILKILRSRMTFSRPASFM